MTAPITDKNLETEPTITAPVKAEPAKTSATKQQMKAAYLMVLIALMDSLKTGNQTAQIQAKEQSQTINVQQQLISQMRALKSVNFNHSDAFVDCHYWKVVFYTKIIHSGGGSKGPTNRHVIYEKGPVSQTWLNDHVQPNGQFSGTWDKVVAYSQQACPNKTFWKAKAMSGKAQLNLQIEIRESGKTRSEMELKVNMGQQNSSMDNAKVYTTVQGLQEQVAEIGSVSQLLGMFSNQISSI